MYKKFKLRILIFFAIIIALFLAALGIWQLFRLQEKNYFINTVTNNFSAPPKSFEEIDFSNPLYTKIKIKGHFISDKNIYLYHHSPIDKQSGYYLITPFQIENTNRIILVTRGWFASTNKNYIQNIINQDFQEITGIIFKGENKRFAVPNNDLKNNIWFTLDLLQIANFLDLQVETFYLIQITDTENNEYLKPMNVNNLLKIRNDHLEYALTWFSLSAIYLIMFIIYYRKMKSSMQK